jgi:hypothetical protein
MNKNSYYDEASPSPFNISIDDDELGNVRMTKMGSLPPSKPRATLWRNPWILFTFIVGILLLVVAVPRTSSKNVNASGVGAGAAEPLTPEGTLLGDGGDGGLPGPPQDGGELDGDDYYDEIEGEEGGEDDDDEYDVEEGGEDGDDYYNEEGGEEGGEDDDDEYDVEEGGEGGDDYYDEEGGEGGEDGDDDDENRDIDDEVDIDGDGDDDA